MQAWVKKQSEQLSYQASKRGDELRSARRQSQLSRQAHPQLMRDMQPVYREIWAGQTLVACEYVGHKHTHQYGK